MFIVWVTIIAPTADVAEIVRRRFFQLDKNILIACSFIWRGISAFIVSFYLLSSKIFFRVEGCF